MSWVLDTSALTAHATGTIYTGSLLAWATRSEITVWVPATGLAVAWAATTPVNRYRLELLAVTAPVELDPLDRDNMLVVAELAAPDHGLDYAHAAYLARRHRARVITASPAAYGPWRGIEVEQLP